MSLMKKEDPQYLDLATQRLEALSRTGDYEQVIAAVEQYLRLWPGKPVLQYRTFCALTALGQYDTAAALYQEIVRSAPTARNEFRSWMTKYAFDILVIGQSWHPPDRQPAGVAFLPMMEAEEMYRGLSAQARRVVADGFTAHWSPKGKKLAFSMGVQDYSGVAVYDPATKETDLLIAPGKDPKWSADGRHIAFVRDREALHVPELAERRDQPYPRINEEVWVMKSDGTEPRRLAHGGWPSWSQDSKRVYYQSRLDRTVYSISVEDRKGKPEQVTACSDSFPSISPDGRHLVYLEGSSLIVKNIASRVLVAEWPVLPTAWSVPAWSPAGDELCMGGNGVWIYRFDRKEPVRTLCGPISVGSWSSDAKKLVFNLGPPYYEIWEADLAPHVSAVNALGPGRTMGEHIQEMTAFYTRRIEADPLDADSYLRRAAQYPREDPRICADMRRYGAILNQGFVSDSGLRGPWTFVRVVEGPFDYQLVVFLERQEDGMHVLRIALGQKGRCEMKSFQIPKFVASLLSLCFLSGLDAPTAHADLTFGTPVCTRTGWIAPCISADGVEIYFHVGNDTVASVWAPAGQLRMGNGAHPSILAQLSTVQLSMVRRGFPQ